MSPVVTQLVDDSSDTPPVLSKLDDSSDKPPEAF